MTAKTKRRNFGFLLLHGFPMACLTSAIEPLRAANEIAGEDHFKWTLLSEDGSTVKSSADVAFQPDLKLGESRDQDCIFVLAGPKSNPQNPQSTYGKLRFLGRHGTSLGAVSGGVFHLARAGLLSGHKSSVHWCYKTAFISEFPDLETSDDVLVLGQSRYTASGAAAAFDMMLKFIEDEIGPEIATEVACWFQHAVIRAEGVKQKVPSLKNEETADMLPELVANAIALFSQNLHKPISTRDVAQALNISQRQLERRFQDTLGQSPARYYKLLRMRAARQLVLYSNQPIETIADAVGYNASTAFSRNYKNLFGIGPMKDRLNANSFRVDQNLPIPSI